MRFVQAFGDELPDCGGRPVFALPGLPGKYGCMQCEPDGRGGCIDTAVPVQQPNIGYILNLVNSGYTPGQQEVQVLSAALAAGSVARDVNGKLYDVQQAAQEVAYAKAVAEEHALATAVANTPLMYAAGSTLAERQAFVSRCSQAPARSQDTSCVLYWMAENRRPGVAASPSRLAPNLAPTPTVPVLPQVLPQVPVQPASTPTANVLPILGAAAAAALLLLGR